MGQTFSSICFPDKRIPEPRELLTDAKLNSGATMPLVGFGTWKLSSEDAGPAVTNALESGYRHIDCASIYGNEMEIGRDAFEPVFKKGDIKREDIFVTSKVWNNKHKAADVEQACKDTLANLQLEYLDLYLIHWPVATKDPIVAEQTLESVEDVPIKETWQAMEKLVADGLVKSIGVSNFTKKKLNDLLEYAEIVPAVNQFELHPYLAQPELRALCKEKGIQVTAYSSLGSGCTDLMENPCVLELAKKHSRTPAQILLRWGVQLGCNVLPKSRDLARVAQNREIEVFALDAEDMEALAKLDKGFRTCTGTNIFGPNITDFTGFWDGEWYQ